ncbi:MAG: hypothetical protein H8K04_08845 [Nitrospira sp.]
MFTVELLREWKAQAKENAWQATLYGKGPLTPSLTQTPTTSELSTRLRTAIVADLDVFRRSEKWPSTNIALILEVNGLRDPVNTSALASALATLDDLILVAPPGLGKTTTLFQIAEALLAKGNASPIVVPLGDWSTDGLTLLESILKRYAFRGISEGDLRAVAADPGVILLLDGWNELDVAARRRAGVQIRVLQDELPELRLLITTRKQTLDVPVDGTRVNLLPLSQTQQFDIAKALGGDAGLRMLEQARRTVGVRELVTIPLYLTALLALPEGAPFPTTKEEVLRCFVSVHEAEALRAEHLLEVTCGLHQRYLQGLAVTANRIANTTIPEALARKSVSETESDLVAEGQITEKPQPTAVLETLVSYHLLLRDGEPAGYSFQHQQFQEWYASHFVETLMTVSLSDLASQNRLKTDVLNQPVWEESILFACERLACGDLKQQECCGAAIMAAFEVDPMLAAEMIYRSTDAVWARVGSSIKESIDQWHTPGKVDRAVRFMIISGRHEFFDRVWPLITHEDDQVQLQALRAGSRFRPSLLGKDAAKLIAALPGSTRKHVLCEIAYNSGMEGLDLATAVAKDDPDPEVRVDVTSALAFRRANRHVADVLRCSDAKTFDLVLSRDIDVVATDEHIKREMEGARERQRKDAGSAYDRLRAILHSQNDQDFSQELTAIIAEMEIDTKQDPAVQVIYALRDRYSHSIADGLLQRLRSGRTMFYGADDLLASAGFSLEDDVLIGIVLAETPRFDNNAQAAASVLGAQAVGHIIEILLKTKERCRDESGRYDQVASDRYHNLFDRIGRAPGASLVVATLSLSARVGNEELATLAELISGHPGDKENRGRPFDDDARTTIRTLAESWGNRMLASGDATRSQLAWVAILTRRAPSETLLPLLKWLLDEELKLWRSFKEQARTDQYRGGTATNEARTSWTWQYQLAFQAISGSATTALMRDYLADIEFGHSAASVLANQWTASNEPSLGYRFGGGVDFSRFGEKRAARAKDATPTSLEAESIFAVIEQLIADGATEDHKRRAVALGIVATRLPHGQRQAMIQKLIALASRRSRAALLQSLILSGETIDISLVKTGIAEVLEAAKTDWWILEDDHSTELDDWLRLLPFTSSPSEAVAIVRNLPEDLRRPDRLREMISNFGATPADDAESVLFQLAEADPRLYDYYAWRQAAIDRGTFSSALRLVDLAAKSAFDGLGAERWPLARQIGTAMSEFSELRKYVYQLLERQLSLDCINALCYSPVNKERHDATCR